MSQIQPTTKSEAPEMPWSPDRTTQTNTAGYRTLGRIVTVAAVVVAAVLGYSMWNRYMSTLWTRDGTVRAYVATVAPEVSGNIVELTVGDNQQVKKGDILFRIDPVDYRIALTQAEASHDQAVANLENIVAEISIQEAQVTVNSAQVDQADASLEFARLQADRYDNLQRKQTGSVQEAQQYQSQLRQQEASLRGAKAALAQAQNRIGALQAQRRAAEASITAAEAQVEKATTSLQRTNVRSPVDGWVTNLRAQVGNFATAGKVSVSVVDQSSFWIDAYFEETAIAAIKPGTKALIRLMGRNDTLKGHVESMARAIDVANAQPNDEGVATVNPVFTWVRLAQRIPVRVRFDNLSSSDFLAAGMTATVAIDDVR